MPDVPVLSISENTTQPWKYISTEWLQGGRWEVEGHKGTGGGIQWYGRREALTPLSPPLTTATTTTITTTTTTTTISSWVFYITLNNFVILVFLQGYGSNFFSANEYYEGEWYANKRSGWGRMYYADGSVYEGEWYDDMRNGEGMYRLGKCIFRQVISLSFVVWSSPINIKQYY